MPAANKYPKWMNEYLKRVELEIAQIPDNYRIVGRKDFPNINIKSARQLHEHIEREEEFWTNDVVKNNHIVKNYPRLISAARDSFINAVESEDEATGHTVLGSAIDNIRGCTISSMTELAKIFEKHSMEPAQFFLGFEASIANTSRNLQSLGQNQLPFLKGFVVGLEYNKVISELYSSMVGEEMMKFNSMADEATEKINEIMKRADNDYEDHHQKHVDLFTIKKEKHEEQEKEIAELVLAQKKDFGELVLSCYEKQDALEKTYKEHLKLSKPAEYWHTIEKNYIKSGRLWLGSAIIVTLVAITMLSIIILEIDPFDLEDWAEGIRMTALITMLITIFMFVIRFTSKMATSSFHLARDAKEREQLSYFYLALVKENAVPESERHLVISALFSRSDTGLLKGDSSPEMPSSSFVVEKIAK